MRRHAVEKITGLDVVESLMRQAVTPGKNLCKLKGLDVKIDFDSRTFMTTMVSVQEVMRILEQEVWSPREPWSSMNRARAATLGAIDEIRPILNVAFASRYGSASPRIWASPFIVADAAKPNMLYIAKPGTLVPRDALRQFKYSLKLAELIDAQDEAWRDQLFAAAFHDAYENIMDTLLFFESDDKKKRKPNVTVWNTKSALIDFEDGTKFTCSDVVENGWFNLDKVVEKAMELAT